MNLLWLCLVVSVGFLVQFVAASEEEVDIEVLSKHENCEREAKEGDLMVMHYTGYLAKDNTKFDSRLVSFFPLEEVVFSLLLVD
jgi:FKBP-type peptidyl-prolyl cis-trans isomerase